MNNVNQFEPVLHKLLAVERCHLMMVMVMAIVMLIVMLIVMPIMMVIVMVIVMVTNQNNENS